jgi:hypothetical protein
MGVFNSSRHFPLTVPDLSVVASDVEAHFRGREFDVQRQPTLSGWQVDVSKGGMFKAVFGLRTAMKIEIENAAGGVQAKAGIGIWGQQMIPTAITLFVFWPVLITQIWGMVESSKLDDEAMQVIAESLATRGGVPGPVNATLGSAPPASGRFCTACGQSLPGAANFCPECGAKAA